MACRFECLYGYFTIFGLFDDYFNFDRYECGGVLVVFQ